MKIEFRREDLRAALSAVLPFASKDVTRPALTTVSVRGRDGKVALICTDGHTLCSATLTPVERIHVKDWIGTLDADAAALLHVQAKQKGDEVLPIDVPDEDPDKRFPDVERCIPAATTPQACVNGNHFGFNVDYFARIAKVCKALGFRKPIVTLQISSPREPLRCDIDGGNVSATVVIMPVNVDGYVHPLTLPAKETP